MPVDGIREWLTCICLVGAAASTVAWAIAVVKCKMENGKCRIAEFHSKFSIHTAAFIFFATIATLSAQKQGGGTNAPPQGASPPQMMMGSPLAMQQTPAVSPEDVVRGYRLDYVFTNAAYSYAMPTNGVRYDKWWKRGAYEDVFRLDLGGMTFPLVDELLSSFWVYSWGMAGAHLGNASNRLVATGTPMSAVPGLSQFWSAALPDGDRRLTWQDFALGRDPDNLVSAQLELFQNGDFIARSNEVMRVYRRVNPDDWDDDGDPNGTDPDPYVAGEPTFGPQQQLPPVANSNAYCWVDLVVSGAASLVTFSGEGASNLPDPSFIALPGETNRVMLLIGKEYRVASRMPICCVGLSDYAIEVSQDSATSLSIVWPVTIEPVAMRSGASFSMSVVPDFLGGGFTWTNCCCSISSSGNSFTYSCDENCHCSGCAALGCYTYEGFTLPASGGSCGCAGISEPGSGAEEEDDDGPYAGGASATFTKSAILFEDPYENTPGSWIGRHSTTTELHCVAHGGPNGGHVRFEVSGAARLNSLSGPSLPLERDVSAGKRVEFSVIYEGVSPSASAGDVVATATFTENAEGAEPASTSNSLTCAKIEIVPTCSIGGLPNRHCLGLREGFMIEIVPSGLDVTVSRNAGWELNNVLNVPVYTCPLVADGNGVIIHAGNTEYTPQLSVVEPQGIVCTSGSSACGYGVIAMQLEPYIVPQYVSFSNIKMMEVPSMAGGPTGYFTNAIFEAYWHHTTNRGAGVWHRPRQDNFFFADVPSFDLYCPPPLTAGTITWVVPIGWGDDGATSLEDIVDTMPTLYNQVYTLDEDGGLRIDKFSQWIKMDVLGGITHSPGISESE